LVFDNLVIISRFSDAGIRTYAQTILRMQNVASARKDFEADLLKEGSLGHSR
jgi:hypothetical protein